MKEYIDKSALIEEIWKNHKETEKYYDLCVDELKDVYCGVVATIDEQPTITEAEIRAKAIDDVIPVIVEELETDSSVKLYGSGNSDNYLIPVKRVIEIVKQGGVSDD